MALTCAVYVVSSEDTLKALSDVPKPTTLERWGAWADSLQQCFRRKPPAVTPCLVWRVTLCLDTGCNALPGYRV